jgi:hypothetical protein
MINKQVYASIINQLRTLYSVYFPMDRYLHNSIVTIMLHTIYKKRIVAQAGIFLFLDIMLYTDKITIACIQITTTVNSDLTYHILFSIFMSLFYVLGCYPALICFVLRLPNSHLSFTQKYAESLYISVSTLQTS